MAKLYFYYSSMNAGKSTVLLQSSYNYRERGLHTLMFVPAIDNRAGVGRIQSRIGLAADANAFAAGDDLLERVRAEHAARPARLRAGRRGAVPQPRAGAAAQRRGRRAANPGALLRPAHRFSGQPLRGQRRAAGLGRHPDGDQDHLPLRAEGHDGAAAWTRRAGSSGGRADRDRRQRPVRLRLPPAFQGSAQFGLIRRPGTIIAAGSTDLPANSPGEIGR